MARELGANKRLNTKASCLLTQFPHIFFSAVEFLQERET
jgi:hypothetical protein